MQLLRLKKKLVTIKTVTVAETVPNITKRLFIENDKHVDPTKNR